MSPWPGQSDSSQHLRALISSGTCVVVGTGGAEEIEVGSQSAQVDVGAQALWPPPTKMHEV